MIGEHPNSRLLAALRLRAADRRAHTDYLESLIEDAGGCADLRYLVRVLDDVRVPRGVTRSYAFALVEDIVWIFDPKPTRDFPNDYACLRERSARELERNRARRRAFRQGGELTVV